ncbi:hypothetical protein DLD77_03495 [Chitinophaga alhagiae]|uniref:Lipoprotein n=1 Tax=Chitinophaga alhagiae TaxID=2203219 RepID=A0ABN5LNJ7_9BACT|nr:hypothetical protein [Chitinophaga alhagiae]AWO00824.1 hypothetical protein DLD77_03495 [Chitinophaga alhagiae]
MTGRKNIYGWAALAAMMLLFSCGVFNSKAPLRQCYVKDSVKVLLRGKDATGGELYIYKGGQQVHVQELLPYAAMISHIERDTVHLFYFQGKDTGAKEGRVQAGDNMWLKWIVRPRGEMATGNMIVAAKFDFRNNRLEVRSPGADIRLSFPLNNILLEQNRVVIVAHGPLRTTIREIQLPENGLKAFVNKFERYGDDGTEKKK